MRIKNRLLSELEKYDSSMTIGELLTQKIKEEAEIEEKENLEVERIKTVFEAKNFKFLDETLFPTLKVVLLSKYLRKERTTHWDWIFFFETEVISFSKHSVHHSIKEEHFSLEMLESIVPITTEDFQTYFNTYNKINNELERILCE